MMESVTGGFLCGDIHTYIKSIYADIYLNEESTPSTRNHDSIHISMDVSPVQGRATSLHRFTNTKEGIYSAGIDGHAERGFYSTRVNIDAKRFL